MRHLNFIEYVGLVQEPVRAAAAGSGKTTASEDVSSAPRVRGERRGRQTMTQFAYANGHPLLNATGDRAYQQKLYALQKTVCISGSRPPPLPSACDKNLNSKLDAFAEYYLLLFKPWDDPCTGPHGNLDWESFASYVEELAMSACFWDQRRLGMMQCMAQAGRLPAETKALLSAYRFRAADRWDDADTAMLAPSTTAYSQASTAIDAVRTGGANDHDADPANDDINDRALNQMIDFGQAEARYFKKQNYLMEQAPHLEMLRRSIPKPGADEGQRRRRHAGIVFKNATKIDQIGKVLEGLKAPDRGVLVAPSKAEPSHSTSWRRSEVAAVENELGLEFANIIDGVLEQVDKRKAIKKDLVDSNKVPDALEPCQVFLTGGPGVGKTTLIEKLRSLCTVVAVAPTGIAASHIQGASTHYHLFDIAGAADRTKPPYNFPSHTALKPRAIRPIQEADVFLVDEISMATDQTLGLIDHYLRQIRGEIHGFYKQQPFGGMIMIICGDFFQLPPVKYDALYQSVPKHFLEIPASARSKDNLKTRGNERFPFFVRQELTRQHRLQNKSHATAAQQEVERKHRNLIDRFRTEESPLDNDEAVQYLQSRIIPCKPTCRRTEFNNVSDPDWQNATYIVSNNAQRHAINFARAEVFARNHDTVLLWWPTHVIDDEMKHMSEEDLKRFYASETALWEYFVAGAPCYLTENTNPVKVCVSISSPARTRCHAGGVVVPYVP